MSSFSHEWLIYFDFVAFSRFQAHHHHGPAYARPPNYRRCVRKRCRDSTTLFITCPAADTINWNVCSIFWKMKAKTVYSWIYTCQNGVSIRREMSCAIYYSKRIPVPMHIVNDNHTMKRETAIFRSYCCSSYKQYREKSLYYYFSSIFVGKCERAAATSLLFIRSMNRQSFFFQCDFSEQSSLCVALANIEWKIFWFAIFACEIVKWKLLKTETNGWAIIITAYEICTSLGMLLVCSFNSSSLLFSLIRQLLVRVWRCTGLEHSRHWTAANISCDCVHPRRVVRME